jgi:hypothetical protein
MPPFIKNDIKIGLAKGAEGAKIANPPKIAERTLSLFLSFFLCALCVLCENLFYFRKCLISYRFAFRSASSYTNSLSKIGLSDRKAVFQIA